jgi:glycosyltransferase involved in cell wall biosynthesis
VIADLRFLDSILEAAQIRRFWFGEESAEFASTAKGLQSARGESASLCFWAAKKTATRDVLKRAQQMDAQFLFPYGELKPSQIAKLGSFRGPEVLELPDPRIRDISLLSPRVEVLQAASLGGPAVSVIIPTFDNRERALRCLKAWLDQDHSSYELILVDDGGGAEWISSLAGVAADRLTLLRLSRERLRARGDHQFRAGLARNSGLVHARGKKIVFCDSDIFVSRNFLNEIEVALQDADLVMPRRWQLGLAASEGDLHYEDLVFHRDVVLSPGAHWESFQTDTKDWSKSANPWRWASTFCLATTRDALSRVGHFKKSFVSYGFEDTELGYRFYRQGFRFKLLPVDTFHLHQPAHLSEYANDQKRKKRLLRISADRFFRHHPNHEVFEALQDWLD